MSASRIVSVFGATGLQGAAVVRALLKDGTFTPRAITRNPESAAALKLKAEGAEVVKGDPLDRTTLTDALRGSEAVFGVTATIYPISAEGPNELVQGKNMVDAAKEAGVKYFIFTSLPSLSKISGGQYKNALHFEQKAAVEDYLRASGLKNTSLHLSGFLENFWTVGQLKKSENGLEIPMPFFTGKDHACLTWVEHDVPAVVLALLKNYTDASKGISGNIYPIITTSIPYADLAALIENTLGVKTTFTTAPPTGVPAYDEMFKHHAEHGMYPDTPVPNPDLVALGVKFGTIQEFVEKEVKLRFG
ncbi:hypothetical protein DFH06DRAFT_1011921 [Mycena polygramma]|nr:hypothetical protein DFH06DRAFT_1011921 [Mycena polygramma]